MALLRACKYLLLMCLLAPGHVSGETVDARFLSIARCIPDGSDCQSGVDCCGVCVFSGRAATCQSCVSEGSPCADPNSNPCCGGATKRYDKGVVNPAFTCQTAGNPNFCTCQVASAAKPGGGAGQCIPDGSDCQEGVDCCGVCVFSGRASTCQSCVPAGGECPDANSNPCCGGATKRYDQGIVNPAYTCQGTGEINGQYGFETHTCQAA